MKRTDEVKEAGQDGIKPDIVAAEDTSTSLGDDPALVGDFIFETREHLARIETELLALEREPASAEPLHSVFRGYHTIKGLAGFLEFAEIRDVSHEVETALDLARNGKLAVTGTMIDVVLQSADYLRKEIDRVEARLNGLETSEPANPAALLELVAGLQLQSSAEAAGSQQRRDGFDVARVDAIADELKKAAGSGGTGAERAAVRVDASKLDHLLDMVGEMVIAQSMVMLDSENSAGAASKMSRNLTQLARVTEEVQKTAVALRMVPIGSLFRRVQRFVRDLSRKLGKQAVLQLSGEETEIDKAIVEDLADPLLHMVRNAIDHGVELPDERAAKGKPASATITLRARHQAGSILIEISDDGRGLDSEKILAKARERGLIDESSVLTQGEIFQLILEPGFSTAARVTDTSGRGVGMDVVRKQVQKLRGKIEIQSESGRGTSFILKLPLTLAIIDGLVVRSGGERYVVPIYAVKQVLRPPASAISSIQNHKEMVMVRDELMPLVRLDKRFGLKAGRTAPSPGMLIVAESDDNRFGLLVDEFLGKQEVVIKGLGEALKNIPGVAGGAILGDGRVGLILDLNGIYREAA
jgi:two-component system chemotaxis sensor kinase CheA